MAAVFFCFPAYKYNTLIMNQSIRQLILFKWQQQQMKILKALGISTIAAITFASYYHPLEIKGQPTKNLFKFLSNFKQQYSLYALKTLIRFQFTKNTGSLDLKNKIIAGGFDQTGNYISGLRLIGLGGVQIGPVTYTSQDSSSNLGINQIKANINGFLQAIETKEQKNERIKNFKIGVCIIPDSNTIEYTPYLIPQNIMKTVNSLHELSKSQFHQQKTTEGQKIDVQENSHNSIDFISVQSHKLANLMGKQLKQESELMVQKLLDNLTIDSSRNNLAVYKITEDGHKAVYLPARDKTGLHTYPNQYEFISWKYLIEQILKQ